MRFLLGTDAAWCHCSRSELSGSRTASARKCDSTLKPVCVFYEMGLCTKSIDSIEIALRKPCDAELRSKFRRRFTRSLLQAQRYDQADEALRDPWGQVDDTILLSTVSQPKSMSQIGKRRAIWKIIMQLPGYMSTLISGCEYYNTGQEGAEAQSTTK